MPGITLNNISQISPRDLLNEIRRQNPPPLAHRFLQDIEDYWQDRDPETNNPSQHLLSIIKDHASYLASWNVFQIYIASLLLYNSSSIRSIPWIQKLIARNIEWELPTAPDNKSKDAALLQQTLYDCLTIFTKTSLEIEDQTKLDRIGYRKHETTSEIGTVLLSILAIAVVAGGITGLVYMSRHSEDEKADCANQHLINFNSALALAQQICEKYNGIYCFEPPNPPPSFFTSSANLTASAICAPIDECEFLGKVDFNACCVDEETFNECYNELYKPHSAIQEMCLLYSNCYGGFGIWLIWMTLELTGMLCVLFGIGLACSAQSKNFKINIDDPSKSILALLEQTSPEAKQWYETNKDSLSQEAKQTLYIVLALARHTKDDKIILRATPTPEKKPSLLTQYTSSLMNVFRFNNGYQNLDAPPIRNNDFQIN